VVSVTEPCNLFTDLQVSLLTPEPILPGELAEFSVDLSPDGATAPFNYTVQGGPVQIADTDPFTFTLSFEEPGTYTVEVAAWNCDAAEPIVNNVEVFVSEPPCEPPAAGFTFMPEAPFTSNVITFTAEATGTEPIEFVWDFGDSITGTGSVITHSYTIAGAYTVTLTAENACGVDTVQELVVVSEPCDLPVIEDFGWSPVQPVLGSQVTFFTIPITGTAPYEYVWDWGDRIYTGTAPVVIRYFDVPGTYTVTLTVANECGIVEFVHEVIVLETLPLIYDAYLPLIWKVAGP
jgi:PKD repeat protein